MDGLAALDRFFNAEQNVRTAQDAEESNRAMFGDSVSSWNLHDCHLMEKFTALSDHLSLRQPPAKIEIWPHNAHVEDFRATAMGQSGESDIGQLVRQRHGDGCRIIGFTTYLGNVTATSEWKGPAEQMQVRRHGWTATNPFCTAPAFLLSLST